MRPSPSSSMVYRWPAILMSSLPMLLTAAPKPEPGGVRTTGYFPSAGYARSVERERAKRRAGPALMMAPALMGLAPAGPSTRLLPVICLDFSNRPRPFAAKDYEEMLFRPEPGRKTMTQYYRDISHGQWLVSGKVFGWYHLPNEDTYYEAGHHGAGLPFGELLEFGLTAADADTDFGNYDNDGPDGIPNSGDDDGIVDTVVFIHPENGGESFTGNHNIWSHSWNYRDPSYGHQEMFPTKDVRRDAQGEVMRGADGKPLYVQVDDYIIQPALTYDPNDPTVIRKIEIGVFCHEYGHALRLPDLYDRTPKEDPDTQGIGYWCVMGYGSYGGYGKTSATPTAMSAWCKQQMGWAKVVTLTQSGTYPLETVSIQNQVYRIDAPDTAGKEYFLLEFRDPTWHPPTGVVNWDQDLPVRGLAIWHVDETVGAGSGFPNTAENFGQNDAPSMPETDVTPANWQSPHSLVALLQPDGRLDLENNRNTADAGDLLVPGKTWGDDSQLLFGSRDYLGRKTGIEINELDLVNRRLRVTIPPSAPLPPLPLVPPIAAAPAPPLPAVVAGATPAPPAPPVQPPAALKPLNDPLPTGDAVGTLMADPGVKSLLLPKPEQKTFNPEKVFQGVQAALDQKTGGKVMLPDRAAFQSLTEAQIVAGFTPENQPLVRTLAAQSRTKMISPESPTATKAEAGLVELLRTSEAKNAVKARFSPAGDAIEALDGLSIPVRGANGKEDAAARLNTDFKNLLGTGVILQKVETEEPGRVTYQQFTRVGELLLPISGAEVAFYYGSDDHQQFTGLTSQIVPPAALKVTGKPGMLEKGAAQELAAKYLGEKPQRLEDATEVVKLFQSDPSRARVAIRMKLSVGEKLKPLEVFMDAETRRILSIE